MAVPSGRVRRSVIERANAPEKAPAPHALARPRLEREARELGEAGLTDAQLGELDRVHNLCMDATAPKLPGLALADREEEMAEWLEEKGIDEAVADDLARTPISRETLEHLASFLQGKTLATALRWLAAGYAACSVAVDIERAALRIHTLVSAVKGFTHMDRDLSRGPVDLRAGIVDTVAILDGKARRKPVTITLDIPSDIPPVQGVSTEINQIWMNLIDNAIAAAPSNGHVRVAATRDDTAVLVRVVDDGPGIPADIRDKIFDPFFTTKEVGKGTGLGLSISYSIIEKLGGHIRVASEVGKGTSFILSLPLAEEEKWKKSSSSTMT